MNPSFDVMAQVLNGGNPSRVPLYEHFVDLEIIEEIMGFRLEFDDTTDYFMRLVQFYEELGYDYVPLELAPNFAQRNIRRGQDTALYSRGERHWVDEGSGPIQTMDALLACPWPQIDHAVDYSVFELVGSLLPPGMKIIGGGSGGPFEHASFLMGLENLSLAVYTDPDLVEELFQRIGATLVGIAERLAPLDCIGAYRFGDDLGYKTGTMFSPEHIRRYILPWYQQIAEVVHRAGKPLILHSCGQLKEIMEDIIAAGVDAKHSFEDAIMPVTEAKRLWGDRIAILGGVDVNFLCLKSEQEVYDYTCRILEQCAPDGGYAAGSGNTIANYVPVSNYLAMVKAVRDFNG